MAWYKGSATDYKDLLNQLSAIGEDENMATATIYDGGSGYIVGEIISITGGTATHAPEVEVISIETGDTLATVASIVAGGTGYAVGDTVNIDGGTYTQQGVLEVTTESAGVVTGLQINNAGVYSVQPGGTVATTKITGSGDDALTVTLTWNSSVTGIVVGIHISDHGAYSVTPTSPVATTASASGVNLQLSTTYVETAWDTIDIFDLSVAASAVVSAGGTGYSVSDVLNVEGGTGVTAQAQFTVSTVSGGVVTGITLTTAGKYYTTPSNPAATTSGGGGTGCTLTVTWDTTTSRRCYLHNTNTDVYMGIRTQYNSTYSAYSWRLVGYTGYTSALTDWEVQPGFSGDDECYVSLANSSINYWFSINDNRITGIFEVGSSYPNMYMGLLEPWLTAAEYPYPLLIQGSNTRERPASEALQGGMPNPGSTISDAADEGPGRIRKPDGTWESVKNWYGAVQTMHGVADIGMQPTQHWDLSPVTNYADMGWYDRTTAPERTTWNIFVGSGFVDSINGKLKGASDEYVLIPLSIADHDLLTQFGVLENVYWFDNHDYGVAAKDRIVINGVRYMVFQNCTRAIRNHFFCVKEA